MDDSSDLSQLLIDDVFEAVSSLSKHPRERRTIVRSVFSAIEGLLARLRQVIESGAGADLTPAELLALREETYRVTESGDTRIVAAHQTLKQRVRFTAALVQKLHPEYAIDFNQPAWVKLLSALDVRDRLTHPKVRADMDVSIDEVTEALDGFDWFFSHIISPGHAGLAAYVNKKYLAMQMQQSLRSTQSHIMFGPLRNAFDLTGHASTPLPMLEQAARISGRAIQAPPPPPDSDTSNK